MKVLVTGAAGQLGGELRALLDREMPGKAIYTTREDLDLTDADAVERLVRDAEVTHIVNCAAYTAVDRAEEEKLLCTSVNVDAVKNIAKAAEAVGAKVIHISTDYVFDGTNHRPYRESDKVNPISHYGSTKRKGETALLALAPDSVILRTAWLYAPRGRNFVRTILDLAASRPSIRVVCDQIGTPTYARDLALAVLAVLRSPQWMGGIYHFTDEGAASWYDFAKAVLRFAGKDTKVVPIPTEDYPTAAARPAYSLLDHTRFKATFGMEIPHWEEALADCVKTILNPQEPTK